MASPGRSSIRRSFSIRRSPSTRRLPSTRRSPSTRQSPSTRRSPIRKSLSPTKQEQITNLAKELDKNFTTFALKSKQNKWDHELAYKCHSYIENFERILVDPQNSFQPEEMNENLFRLKEMKKFLIDTEMRFFEQLQCDKIPLNQCNDVPQCELIKDLFRRSHCTTKKSYQFLQQRLKSNPTTLSAAEVYCNSLTDMRKCKANNCKVKGLLHKKCVSQ